MVDCVVELFSCTCESKNGLYSWVALLSVLIQEYIIYRNSYLRVITWPKKKKVKKVKSKNWHVTVSALCSYFNRLLCFRTCALYNPRNDRDPEMIPNPEMIPKSTPEWCRPRNDPQIDPEMMPTRNEPHFSSRRPGNVGWNKTLVDSKGSSNRCAEWRWSDMSDPFKQDLREFEERKLNRFHKCILVSWHSTWRHSRANMLYKFYIYLVSSITPRSLAALTGSSSTIGSHLPAAKYD